LAAPWSVPALDYGGRFFPVYPVVSYWPVIAVWFCFSSSFVFPPCLRLVAFFVPPGVLSFAPVGLLCNSYSGF